MLSTEMENGISDIYWGRGVQNPLILLAEKSLLLLVAYKLLSNQKSLNKEDIFPNQIRATLGYSFFLVARPIEKSGRSVGKKKSSRKKKF